MKITLTYKLLWHDIQQQTWRMAETLIEDEKKRQEAQAEDSASDKTYYLRLIQEGIAYMSALLSDELVKSSADAVDDLQVDKTTWDFTFKDSADRADSKPLADAMHALVVAYVMSAWAKDHIPAGLAHDMGSAIQAAGLTLLNSLYSLDAPIKHRRRIFTEETEITVE